MKKGLVEFSWDEILNYSDEDISYFLFMEGKSIESIAKIRNIHRTTVQNHIIQGKIKYGFLAKSKNSEELFKLISKAGKRDKIEVLNSLSNENKLKLTQYIRDSYTDMYPKDKEVAVWMIGELKDLDTLNILIKASVHKFVNIRRMAVSAMGKFENGITEIALLRALDDENSQVVMYAIKALQNLKSIKAVDKIINIRNTTSKKYLKDAAERFLEEINIE